MSTPPSFRLSSVSAVATLLLFVWIQPGFGQLPSRCIRKATTKQINESTWVVTGSRWSETIEFHRDGSYRSDKGSGHWGVSENCEVVLSSGNGMKLVFEIDSSGGHFFGSDTRQGRVEGSIGAATNFSELPRGGPELYGGENEVPWSGGRR